MIGPSHFSADCLRLDPAAEAERIVTSIQDVVLNRLKRRGVVIGVSGGIDSSVVAYLCARALGEKRALLLFMPDADSAPESLRLSRLVADSLHATAIVEDIAPILAAAQCYRRRDEAIRHVIPEYREGYKCRIVLPSVPETDLSAVFSVLLQSPTGERTVKRLSASAYLGILAATTFNQRVRKLLEYYHADLHQYAVAGTPNRLEYDQGLFVKNSDGAADFTPIAHLYKSQVLQLAEYLGVPADIWRRPLAADGSSLEQPQEDFSFALPLEKMDLCLYARDHEIPVAHLARTVGLQEAEVQSVYSMIDCKRKVAQYLRTAPALLDPVRAV